MFKEWIRFQARYLIWLYGILMTFELGINNFERGLMVFRDIDEESQFMKKLNLCTAVNQYKYYSLLIIIKIFIEEGGLLFFLYSQLCLNLRQIPENGLRI